MLSGLKGLEWTEKFSTIIVFEETKPQSLATLTRMTVGYTVLLCHCVTQCFPSNVGMHPYLTEAHPHIIMAFSLLNFLLTQICLL